MKKTVLLFLLLGVCMSPYSFSDEAKIYFTNWNYVRRNSLSEDDVRQRPDIYIHITDTGEVRMLKNCLTSNLAGFDENINHVDIVIDIISNGEIAETYIINKFAFYRKGDSNIYVTPEIILRKYTLYPAIPAPARRARFLYRIEWL
jgi:hypothetical protein